MDLAGGRANTRAVALDVKDAAALLSAVAEHDIVIRCDMLEFCDEETE